MRGSSNRLINDSDYCDFIVFKIYKGIIYRQLFRGDFSSNMLYSDMTLVTDFTLPLK